MLINHRNVNKSKTDTLSEYDVKYHYLWVKGWRGDPADFDKYMKIVNSTYTPIPKKFRFTTTRILNGICLDCNKQRCTVCNGCPNIDIETQVINYKCDESTPLPRCQRCTCKPYEVKEPLNQTAIPLDVLVRKRQGPGNKKEKNNGDLKQ